MDDVIEGRAWVFGDSVDTDNMYPGFAMKLTSQEAAKHVFYDLRPGWTDLVRRLPAAGLLRNGDATIALLLAQPTDRSRPTLRT